MADAASRIFNVMKRSGTDTVSELVHLKVKTVNPLTLILDDRVILTEDFFELSKSINVVNIHVDDILVGISLNGGQKYLIQENSNDETGGLPSGGFAGEVLGLYSENEMRISTWIDGKPIYRKVVTDTTEIAVGETSIPHNIPNLKMCINIRAFKWDASGNQIFIFPYTTIDGKETYIIQVTNTDIVIRSQDTWSSANTTYFILEYTKTTD